MAVRGRDRERKGNKEVDPAGLTLWTSQRDRLHNWHQFSPLPVSTTFALRLCSVPHFHGESEFSHSLTLILVRGLTLVNGIVVHMTHKGSNCPCHHQENLPQLTCCRRSQETRGVGPALYCSLARPACWWLSTLSWDQQSWSSHPECELNQCLPSHVTEICVVVYYTEMALWAQRSLPAFLHLMSIGLFSITKMEASKRQGFLPVFCYISNTNKKRLGHCGHSINIWWIKQVWAALLSLQAQALTNTSHRSDGVFLFWGVFFYFLNLFIYLLFILIFFWLCWVFVAARGLSLVAASGGYSSLRCAGFSLRWLLSLWSTGSRCTGFSSCGSQALDRRLNCGTRA